MKFDLIIDKNSIESVVATVHQKSELTDKIEDLVLKYNGEDKLLAYNENDMMWLTFPEIECITIIDGKTYAITRSGEKLRIRQRLYEIETVLPSYFIRINKSSLANEKFLVRFSTTFSGAVDAIFESGYKEYVSRRCFAEIKRRLTK